MLPDDEVNRNLSMPFESRARASRDLGDFRCVASVIHPISARRGTLLARLGGGWLFFPSRAHTISDHFAGCEMRGDQLACWKGLGATGQPGHIVS